MSAHPTAEQAPSTTLGALPTPMSDRMTAFYLQQARELLADIDNIDYSDERRPYYLLGAAQPVITALIRVIERGEQR